MPTIKEEPTLIIGHQRVKLTAVINKMQQDIAFLTSRISALQKQASPNPATLLTYETMLDSRRNVLQWIKSYSSDNQEQEQELPLDIATGSTPLFQRTGS